jgi:hypothetical protein
MKLRDKPMPFLLHRTLTVAALLWPADAFAQAATAAEQREQLLLERIAALEARLAKLEALLAPPAPGAPPAPPASPAPSREPARESEVSLNFFFDGHAGWNANRPWNRTNLLRAYDGTASGFHLNQTGMVAERTADVAAGRRWGYRLDLMAGQATETLQGSPLNETRPQVYRHLFQAYGTYVLPVGKGLTVDFGKWASALGPEGNYTKDQINYSRSYFFNFLPFYHMGFRSTYAVNPKMNVSYWLVNGANQTEDFNGFKSQLGQVVFKPTRNLTWTLNYYNGREQRNNGDGRGAPRGRFHVVDTYAFWSPTAKLTLGGEFDVVVNRVEANGPPQRVTGGAAYLRYQLTPRTYFGQRYTRLNDPAGLFSGAAQNLNDTTSTFGFRPAEGFETRLEYRRDFSNRPFFPRSQAGPLAQHQDTFTLGLLWWFGSKAGSW